MYIQILVHVDIGGALVRKRIYIFLYKIKTQEFVEEWIYKFDFFLHYRLGEGGWGEAKRTFLQKYYFV